MRSYPVPEAIQPDVGAASLRLESVERLAVTASGAAAAWADRVVNADYNQTMAALAACGVCDDCGDRYYGILDPDYEDPLVVGVVSLDKDETLRKWNGSGWEDVPPEMEPVGYQFISLDGSMLADALSASGGLLLRPTSPKAKIRGGLTAAAPAEGKHFAIVDDIDTSAVLDLIEVRPGPVAYVRRDGDWVKDASILGRFRSVDPPRSVQIDAAQLEAVIRSVDEFDRAHADKQDAITASRMMEDQYVSPRTPSKMVAPIRPTGKRRNKRLGTTTRRAATPVRRATPTRSRRSRSTSSKWDEKKYNRVGGKFASKGAVDRHPGPDRKATGGRIRVSQATVDELNRHSMAENIAKANSGKASPEFVEAARRFYPGKIHGGTGTGASRGRGTPARKAAVKAKQSARRSGGSGSKASSGGGKAPLALSKEETLANAAAKLEMATQAKWEIRRRKADLAESKRRGVFSDQIRAVYEQIDPGSDQLLRAQKLIAAEQRRREAYDRAAAYESQAEEIRRLEARAKAALLASVGPRPLTAAVPEHSMMPRKLKGYWTRGKGAAKIRWGTGGDFNRCRRALGKYLRPDQVAGACANLHKAATGTWPGKNRKHGVKASGYESALVFETPAGAVPLATFEGEDPALLAAAGQVAAGIALEYSRMPVYISDGRLDAPGVEGFCADLTDRLHRAGVPVDFDLDFAEASVDKSALPVRTDLGTIKLRSGQSDLGQWELLP